MHALCTHFNNSETTCSNFYLYAPTFNNLTKKKKKRIVKMGVPN